MNDEIRNLRQQIRELQKELRDCKKENMKRYTDKERKMWVKNDIHLHAWFEMSGLSLDDFVKRNQFALDRRIAAQLGEQDFGDGAGAKKARKGQIG